MIRPALLPVFLLLPLTLGACGSDGGDASQMVSESIELPSTPSDGGTMNREAVTSADMPPEAAPAAARAPAAQPDFTVADSAPAVTPIPGAVTLNPMLIRTGTAVLRVDSLQQGIASLRALAQRVGGIVGNTTLSAGTEAARQATVELRIPSENFDRAIGGLSPIGRVESVNVTAEDVGEEYTDVSARVANARRLEGRLLDLLENRTGRLEEVLNVEREVARVREEIERYEGRLRYLRTRASVSILTITLHEGSALGRPVGDRPIRDAFGEAWRTFINFLAGFIASLGILVPLVLLGFLAWRGFRWARRREQERDALYREALRRERERTAAPEEPAARP